MPTNPPKRRDAEPSDRSDATPTPDPLGARVADLHRRFGVDIVTNEAAAISLEWLLAEYELVLAALERQDTSSLMNVRPQARQILLTLVRNPVKAAVEEIAERVFHSDAFRRKRLLQLWEVARNSADFITTTLPKATSVPTDESFLAELSRRLELASLVHTNRLRKSFESHSITLAAVLSHLTAGHDIRDTLMTFSREKTFRELLDALADLHLEYENSSDTLSKSASESSEIIAEDTLRQYFPLIRTWRDLRLELDGRINHPHSIRGVSQYYDASRQTLGAELRAFSPSRQILHIRDDVDDILYLAVGLVSIVADGIQESSSYIPNLQAGHLRSIRERLAELSDLLAMIAPHVLDIEKGSVVEEGSDGESQD